MSLELGAKKPGKGRPASDVDAEIAFRGRLVKKMGQWGKRLAENAQKLQERRARAQSSSTATWGTQAERQARLGNPGGGVLGAAGGTWGGGGVRVARGLHSVSPWCMAWDTDTGYVCRSDIAAASNVTDL